MIFPFFIFAAIVIALFLFFTSKSQKISSKTTNQSSSFPYEQHPAIVTPAERSFLGVLEQTLAGQYRIFVKVRLSDIIKIKAGLSKSERQSAWNQINEKHIDFVLCDADNLSYACVIELDDKSHDSPKRQERDIFVDNALAAANIPIVRFKAKQAYELSDVKQKLSDVLPFDQVKTEMKSEASRKTPSMDEQNQEHPCPKCKAKMVVRTAKKGKHVGQQFFACSAYPSCKTIVPIQ